MILDTSLLTNMYTNPFVVHEFSPLSALSIHGIIHVLTPPFPHSFFPSSTAGLWRVEARVGVPQLWPRALASPP